jgi:hypothetical protein
VLVRFQGNLLSKHDISRYEPVSRQETPTHFGSACVVELINILSHAVIYPISPPAVATDDFKIVLIVKLGSLIWREPFSQKPPAASFLGILGKEVPVQPAHCLRPGSAANEEHALNRQRGEEKIEFLQLSDRMTEPGKLPLKRCGRQR